MPGPGPPHRPEDGVTDAGGAGEGSERGGKKGFQTFGLSVQKHLKHCWRQIKNCQLFKQSRYLSMKVVHSENGKPLRGEPWKHQD